MKNKTPHGIFGNLTSYGDVGFSRYMRRAFLAAAGYDRADLERPIIGIVDTSSDFNPCHRQMPELVQAVKRGVLEAGGLPFAFPTISLHEILTSPTTMLFRNLAAMETEEMIRAQPMDAVVLLGGCDKTLPAQLMAAASVDIPAISVVTGPMLTGSWRGARLGACTDCRRYWAAYRAGELNEEEILEVESSLCTTSGTCMVMGTASTMACVTEALGLMAFGGATAPSATGDRLRCAVTSGRRAVALARAGARPEEILTSEGPRAKENLARGGLQSKGIPTRGGSRPTGIPTRGGSRPTGIPTRGGSRPKEILTRAAFENALTVLVALGGSTNVIIHLLAIARRVGVPLSLEDLQTISDRVPLLVDCKPAGSGYLEDLHRAGGVPVLLKVLEPLLHLDARNVDGRSVGELLETTPAPGDWQSTIRSLESPLGSSGSLSVLRGSLAPDGAVIKTAASSPELRQHKGPAVVFDSPADVAARIDDPSLEIRPEHVLVLRNAGPIGAGMPEAGSIPIPKYLAARGVKDMVRLSDARMSGTAYGTIVLHVSPESAAGGPLAALRNGDLVELDVSARRIDICVETRELERRLADFRPPPLPDRGWRRLYAQHVQQAHLGADLDFL